MWKESDQEWRVMLWRHTLDMLPVEVLVNIPGGGFSLRGHGDVSIYADDIDGERYACMLDEWAALLDCGARLRRRLNLRTLGRRFEAGEREFGFQLSTKLGPLAVRVSFRGAPEEEPFVVRLEDQRGGMQRGEG